MENAIKRLHNNSNENDTSLNDNNHQTKKIRQFLESDNNNAFMNNMKIEKFSIQQIELNLSDNEIIDDNFIIPLDLSVWQRCRITNVNRDAKHDLIVNVYSDSVNQETICRLQGPWSHTRIVIDDIVSILAKWNSKLECFVVSIDYGFVVTNPDFLVSTTSVVGSIFCRRKTVLEDKFQVLDGDSKIMVIGSLVHELFQKTLSNNLRTFKEINELFEQFLQSHEIMFDLYSGQLDFNETKTEIKKFIPNIVKFIEKYIKEDSRKMISKNNNQQKIYQVNDIEENLWIPQLGLKGKIDVSVNIHQKDLKEVTQKIPLELKTGKASFSIEHKGQIILYQMMLNVLHEQINSGLLLYLREDIMKEIFAPRNDQRDLIISRNELAYYLSKCSKLRNKNIKNSCETKPMFLELPEPINHHSACSKCQYNTICTSFITIDKTNEIPSSHPLVEITEQCSQHLKPEDLKYFKFWCDLIMLEEQKMYENSSSSILWTENPEARQKLGRALINLKINGPVEFKKGKYIHNFITDDYLSKFGDFKSCEITLGDYVIVSSLKRNAIAFGIVLNLENTSIKISLERNLSNLYKGHNFIIDKYESKSRMKFSYTNLGTLLNNTYVSNRLRSIIIDKKPPKFDNKLPKIIAVEGANILRNLNPVQRLAVMKALTTQDFMLIKGLPGTGKTQTLVAIIRLFDMLGKSVLITSHTHNAVDNLLIRLKKHKVNFLRLGSENRINSKLIEHTEKHVLAGITNYEELKQIYSSYKIVGVTCLGTSHSIFSHRKFDICIVDEATQVYQPIVLRPLLFTNKFILVGDPDQLPPLIRSNQAKKLGADQSLFHRLDSEEATSILKLQYRMNKTITKLANDLTYQGNLICANKEVAFSCFNLPNGDILLEKYVKEKWILRSLEKHIDQSVVFIDTKNCFNNNQNFIKSRITNNEHDICKNKCKKDLNLNHCDAGIVLTLLNALIIGGCSADRIGIIAPYRAQVEFLNRLVKRFTKFNQDLNLELLEISTVDQYQGKDKDVILYSCTQIRAPKSEEHNWFGENVILEDRNRLTVAITRCKQKLIIIGDEQCLLEFTPYRDLIKKIPGRCKIILEDGKMGFLWDNIFENLKRYV